MQLSEWKSKKNLNVTDAAWILRLHRDVPEGFVRHVKFNGKEKPLEAIADYIRKSKNISTEEALLKSLPAQLAQPEYITYFDEPLNMTPPSQAPENEPTAPPSNSLDRQGPFLPSSQSSPAASDEDSLEIVMTEDVQDFYSENNTTRNAFVPQSQEIDGESAAQPPLTESWTHAEAEPEFQNLIGPFRQNTVVEPTVHEETSLNSMLSCTAPIDGWQQSPDPEKAAKELSEEIARRLGRGHQLGDKEATDLNTNFLRHCCEACIYQGQQRWLERQTAINSAVESFSAIIWNQLDCSLTALNNMVFLMDLYGQKMLAHDILQAVDKAGPMILVISETIRFKQSIPKPRQTPNYDLPSLRQVVELCRGCNGTGPQLLLTAQYNLGWALLEMKQPDEAASILRDILPACESVFGRCQVQTIMCVATLARAHLEKTPPDAVYAESLINESMAPRVRAVFAQSHPFYWEAKNRQALFKLKLAELNVKPECTESYWKEGMALLSEVLEWRVKQFGTNNPVTGRTYRVLKHWLEQRGELHELQNLVATIMPQSSFGSDS